MQHPVGTGRRFVFSEWVPGDHFTATVRPQLLAERAALPRLDHLPTDRRRRGAQQLAQVWHGPDDPLERRADDPRLHGEQQLQMITRPAQGDRGDRPDLLDAQHGHTAATDSRVRQALAYAIDPKLINDTIGYGIAPFVHRSLHAGHTALRADRLPAVQRRQGQGHW